ncbi:endonuclease/exonuclease/phosphatase family protein [Streptomyces sp. NPDC058326]|uniref:endonuclease/exonuclease/phosphatase family protein n=1 Tax=Streptomyces sp. NPDC058326 TaxID=3346447 RepID=UPI0036ECAEB5
MRPLKSGLAMLGSLVFLLVAGVTGAQTARAADVDSSTAPPLRFSTYNICGNDCVRNGLTNDALREGKVVGETSPSGWKADVVFVQEICEYQYKSILAQLVPRGYSGHYAQTIPGETGLCKGNLGYGMAVFTKGIVEERKTLDLNTYTNPSTKTGRKESENIAAPCVKSYLQNRITWACSVHLYWAAEGSDDAALRNAEAVKLGNQVEAWQSAATNPIPVILGGDFNTQPWNTGTDPFYKSTSVPWQESYGHMTEVDETDVSFFQEGKDKCKDGDLVLLAWCRSGETTQPPKLDLNGDPIGTPRKIDYIFVTSGFFDEVKGDALEQDPAVSDHALLRGAARWADCVPTTPADLAKGAVFRVDASGALFRYAAKPGEGIAGACKVGFGWRDMLHVSRQGSTLVAVDPDGGLWSYPVDPATGSYSGSTRVKVGSGFAGADGVLTPGDTDGDGYPDLLVRDDGNLWRHPGTAAGGYEPTGVQVGPPASGKSWGTYDKLIAAGDFAPDQNGPARTDLIGRDAAGDLWLHKGDTAGGYASQTNIGKGWQIYRALAAPGDLNGDSRPDLVGRDLLVDKDYGNLWFYQGDGAGYYAPRALIGNGFPESDKHLF